MSSHHVHTSADQCTCHRSCEMQLALQQLPNHWYCCRSDSSVTWSLQAHRRLMTVCYLASLTRLQSLEDVQYRWQYQWWLLQMPRSTKNETAAHTDIDTLHLHTLQYIKDWVQHSWHTECYMHDYTNSITPLQLIHLLLQHMRPASCKSKPVNLFHSSRTLSKTVNSYIRFNDFNCTLWSDCM